jgi:hypothetical protein
MSTENNARQILLRLGMGDAVAGLVVKIMFVSPAQTDPAMSPVIMLTRHLQQALIDAGATNVAITGQVDVPTARALVRLLGSAWNQLDWHTIASAAVAAAKKRSLAVSANLDLGFLPDLPSIPGGFGTVIAAGLAYYFLVHKK